MKEENPGESQIRKSFAGANILLTGGTGFLGKLLIEKLLRCCPELNKIYLLVRQKKNKDPQTRLKEQFDDVLYETLHKDQPDFIKKVEILEGELDSENLGLTDQDWLTVCDKVNFILHGAATVRFDETLSKAVRINTRGTKEMLKLARCCKYLKAFVYISTAYCNLSQQPIEEKFYDFPLTSDLLIDVVECLDSKTVDDITPGLIGMFPNTYCYTKAAAENHLLKHSQGLPVAILRPSIVISTAKGPIPLGWIDNIYGPTGICVGASVGIIRIIKCNPDAVADLVPADFVVNACIAVAWKTARHHKKTSERKLEDHSEGPTKADQIPRVYNYVSGNQNPITWRTFMNYAHIHGFTMAPSKAVWCYMLFLINNALLFRTLNILLHWIPAYVCDGVAVMIGKKPMLKKVYSKIDKWIHFNKIFACETWKMRNSNTIQLFKELNESDRHIFDFDISALDWNSYMYNYMMGIRLFLIKEPKETIPRGITKQYLLIIANYIVMTIYAIALFWFAKLLGAGVLKLIYKIFS
ncbi:fatty acyl-CoA reductase wat-like [Pieris napi]|uniref:fatty acyl-CoA reductase wat-like n=1 Tax=Pieris napi TaxID=78633 RepID=UPI001FBB583B|nr:fatty acyl-CoA reductase wat-like [Pieris napi]XP_047514036.1 fatty acyl-CoA reductase wat-like [Pieris napi]XP_047514038.1 fatty acyl-CoA reductase wat-like [Pieris napi]